MANGKWQIAVCSLPVCPKLLFLTSPNNPDGSLLAPDDLRRLLDLPLIVVLDEAYIEFAGLERSVVGWVTERENLIVLRTFSKWAGIAGLRLGYGIFPGWLMPALWKAKQPYNVNVAATVAGLASLAYRAEIQTTVDALIVERERLIRELAAFPFLRPYPSRANFVLCRVVDRDAKALKEALAARESWCGTTPNRDWRTASASAPADRSRPMRCWRRLRRWRMGSAWYAERVAMKVIRQRMQSKL